MMILMMFNQRDSIYYRDVKRNLGLECDRLLERELGPLIENGLLVLINRKNQNSLIEEENLF